MMKRLGVGPNQQTEITRGKIEKSPVFTLRREFYRQNETCNNGASELHHIPAKVCHFNRQSLIKRRWHLERILIKPPLKLSSDEIYNAICSQHERRTPGLVTTGGVNFHAEVKVTKDGRRFISLPHNNRIYEGDWGYMSNSMGKDGQRIGQYSVPLEQWAKKL
jgi:hypothetical protein